MAGTIPTQEQQQDSVILKSAHHAEKWTNSAYFTVDGVLFDMVSHLIPITIPHTSVQMTDS